MPRHIKTAALAGHQEEADAKVRAAVEAIIADVRARRDRAVREFSERFDNWSPPSFRLSESDIAAIVSGCGIPWFGGVQAVMWSTPATRAVTIDICAEATIG